MGLKDLFFEEDANNESSQNGSIDDILNEIGPEIDAEVPQMLSNIVKDTYDANGLADLSKSIFKVDELRGTLPVEMQTSIKKQTVLSILSTFQLTVDELILDGKTRKSTLESVLEKITIDETAKIERIESEIEEFKKTIASKEQEIFESKNNIKDATEAITEENTKIDDLLKFIEE